jgi:hypothetical protein
MTSLARLILALALVSLSGASYATDIVGPLELGENSGNVEINSTVSYKLTITSPVVVELTLESGDFDPFLEVWEYREGGVKGDTYEPVDGNQIAYIVGNDDVSEDDDSSHIEMTLQAGEYEVEVSPAFLATAGDFILSYSKHLGSDEDEDGIPDSQERTTPSQYQTNPWLPDSDGDGLLDGEETGEDGVYTAGTDTNPRNADTDGDGIPDGVEVKVLGTNPLDSHDPTSFVDNDHDGLPAYINGDTASTFDPDDDDPDADGDGYGDAYEAAVLALDAIDDASVHPSLGDLNNNGQVDLADIVILKRLVEKVWTLDNDGVKGRFNFDVNRNGILDAGDVTELEKLIAGTTTVK